MRLRELADGILAANKLRIELVSEPLTEQMTVEQSHDYMDEGLSGEAIHALAMELMTDDDLSNLEDVAKLTTHATDEYHNVFLAFVNAAYLAGYWSAHSTTRPKWLEFVKLIMDQVKKDKPKIHTVRPGQTIADLLQSITGNPHTNLN